jgi:YesN/AraC family two-component response regulator
MIKVLIIDDEEIIREGLKLTINWEEMDCTIVGEAEDGEEGLNLINSLQPDIIFTDIRMPSLDGLEMICKIKQLKKSCKIIILTGYRDFEYAQEAVRLGAFRFILKPSKTKDIVTAVKDAVKEINKIKSTEEQYNNLRKKVKELYGLKPSSSPLQNNENIHSNDTPNYLAAKAIKFIKANYDKDLNLKTVADELYISTWHLSKLLKKETGETFINILNEIRIEKAKTLLHNPKYKVYQICELVGFNDVPYFSKLFKKHTNMTPTEYKNMI